MTCRFSAKIAVLVTKNPKCQSDTSGWLKSGILGGKKGVLVAN